MKQIRLVAIVIALIICNAVSAQDYYTGKTHVGENDCFEVLDGPSYNGMGEVCLKTDSPSIFDQYPYDTKTGEIYRVDFNPSAHTYLKPGAMKEIVARVFSREEVGKYENCKGFISIFIAIRPSDGRAMECKYYIHFGENKEFLSIPPEKIKELDKEIKASLVAFYIPEFGKDASYLLVREVIFHKP